MTFTTLYNYFGWIINRYVKEIKSYSYELSEFIEEKTIYPSVTIEVIPTSITDTTNNGQIIIGDVILHIYHRLKTSTELADNDKDYAGEFLNMPEKLNYFISKYGNSVPKEFLCFKPSVKRTGMSVLRTPDDIKESTLTYQFTILDYSLAVSPEYVTVEEIKFDINYDDGQE